jgi:hypothetical protein
MTSETETLGRLPRRAAGGSRRGCRALESDTQELSDRPFQYATAIHEAALEAKGLANYERGFLISGGNEEFARES